MIGFFRDFADAWAEAEKVQNRNIVTDIQSVTTTTRKADDGCYNLMGQKVSPTRRGIYIRNGKKIVVR